MVNNVRLTPKQIVESAIGKHSPFSIAKLAESILQKFGGEEGLAEELYDTYAASDRGSNTRKSILEATFRVLTVAGSGLSDLDGMSVEDLEAEARNLLGEFGTNSGESGGPVRPDDSADTRS